ncbi:MAG: hypothetical protein AB2A00_34935 [Myxococcota bacterium]
MGRGLGLAITLLLAACLPPVPATRCATDDDCATRNTCLDGYCQESVATSASSTGGVVPSSSASSAAASSSSVNSLAAAAAALVTNAVNSALNASSSSSGATTSAAVGTSSSSSGVTSTGGLTSSSSSSTGAASSLSSTSVGTGNSSSSSGAFGVSSSSSSGVVASSSSGASSSSSNVGASSSSSSSGGTGVGVSCETYCNTVMTRCTGPEAQFPDEGSCNIHCQVMASSSNTFPPSGNTASCRHYWASYNQCAQAGPSGGGVCEDVDGQGACEHYCDMALTWCGGATTLFNSRAECLAECANLLFQGGPLDQTRDSISCRSNHLVMAQADSFLCSGAAPVSDVCYDTPERVVAGCGGEAYASRAGDVVVERTGMDLLPRCLKVRVGSTVTVPSSEVHPTMGTQEGGNPFYTPGAPPFEPWSGVFSLEGVYTVYCGAHGDFDGAGEAMAIWVVPEDTP